MTDEEGVNILELDPDRMPPNDQVVYRVAMFIAESVMSDPRIRLATIGGYKADVIFYLHKGAIVRNPQVVFHPH